MYQSGQGVTKDEVEAVKWYRKAADKGDAKAQSNLGSMYFSGLGGLQKNEKEALKWFKKAAEQGDISVLFSGGDAYRQGSSAVCEMVPRSSGSGLGSRAVFTWFYLRGTTSGNCGQSC